MARRVLGNDPFQRGAAARADVPPAPASSRTAEKPARGPRDTPELQTPAAAAPQTRTAKPRGPRAHADAPSVPFEATPHAGAPTAVPLGREPRPHAGSPSVPFDATPHANAPTAHPGAPSGPFEATRVAPTQRSPVSVPAALKGLWRALRTAGGLSTRGTEVDAWGKDPALTRQLRPLAELLVDRYWRVRTEGAELVPPGGCILVANHAGALPLDGPVLHLALQRERPDLAGARWLLEDQVFHAPFVGVLANRLGAVRASPENALGLLAEGRPLVVFPEGFHGLAKGFSERYRLQRFGRGGYLKIALRAGVPVVPVAIVGGEESMPLLGKLPGRLFGVEHLPVTLPPLPARWFIRFAPPIDLSGAPAAPEDDLAWVERTNLTVRDQVSTMLGELLAQRRRVF